MVLYKGQTGDFETVIGLEIHAQIKTKAKLFSAAKTDFGAMPNENVSFVDAAFPGMLPVINEACVIQVAKTGFAISGNVNRFSKFDRKHYFYPDLPSGYQISQFYHPIVLGGHIDIDFEDNTSKTINIERIHMEQDAGKSIHDQSPKESYIDLNRAGVGLMEIVTKPDLSSPAEVCLFLKKMISILKYIDSCDANMEQGNLRCDVNISVRRPGEALGTRCEIKNINSIKFIAQAVNYEISRQIEIIESGDKIIQETRLFDPKTGVTKLMRTKEDALDYRYFPDPDLPPLVLSNDFLDEIKKSLPELPDVKIKKYQKEYNLSTYDANVIVAEPEFATFYETLISKMKHKNYKLAANWMMGELFSHLNKESKEISETKIDEASLAGLLDLLSEKVISGTIAKNVFEKMWNTGNSANKIVTDENLAQINDDSQITNIIEKIVKNESDKVLEYKNGKEKLFGFFVGSVMKESKGKANPKKVNSLLKQALK